MAYAIVETSGTQIRVEPGRFYDVNRLPGEEDATITLDRVLFVENDGDVTIGQPLIDGATVDATIMGHRRGKKVIIYKMQPKKKTRKKRGHRQELTRIMIDAINVNGSTIGESKGESATAAPAEPEAEAATATATATEASETTDDSEE
jgi:large subunit ribosomal protein L21